MSTQGILSEYIDGALDKAEYEKLEDGSYSGCIPICLGVIAFASSLRDCERELRSVLEDWLLLGLKLNHRLPVVGGVDLNKDMVACRIGIRARSGFHMSKPLIYADFNNADPGGASG